MRHLRRERPLNRLRVKLHPLSSSSSLPAHLPVTSLTRPSSTAQLPAAIRTHGLPTLPSFLDSAHFPLPSPYLWNLLLRSSASAGRFNLSLDLYVSMLRSGVRPDNYAFPFAVKSCGGLGDLRTGDAWHQQSLCGGCRDDHFVGAALVDMYSKCGRIDDACKLFDEMPHRDLVCWTSMISGYAHNGCGMEAMEFFKLMLDRGVRPNRVALLGAVMACGNVGARRNGELFHNFMIRVGYVEDLLVATAVIDMYAKCGSLDIARAVFDRLEEKDVVCWSTMIACYGFCGHGRDAIHVFERMIEAGVEPNEVTFTNVLSACSHSGLLEEGQRYFKLMDALYKISPKLNHYTCMVDLLGRVGKLAEAEEVIEKMPMKADSSLWGSLLASCWIYGEPDIGERVANRIFELDPLHTGYYALLSNIYAAKCRWKDVERVRGLMVRMEAEKDQGLSLIDIRASP